jgi:hypothetical protein
MITPPWVSAICSANADFPDAVGPAIKTGCSGEILFMFINFLYVVLYV